MSGTFVCNNPPSHNKQWAVGYANACVKLQQTICTIYTYYRGLILFPS